MHRIFEIAVIPPYLLAGLGLQSLLMRLIPGATVTLYDTFERFAEEDPDHFFHYFAASRLLEEHGDFFEAHRHKTILLTEGAVSPRMEGFHRLDIGRSEEELVRDLLRLHRTAHREGYHGHDPAHAPDKAAAGEALTPRERQVLLLIVRGLLNKEIAAELRIGLTTVISHRRRIMDKLAIRSVAGLTIYAVTHGMVDADAI